MILDGLLTILQSLVGWLLLIVFQMLLRIVDIIEKFFNIFAGTAPVYYKGEENYLFDLFLSNQAITNLFWAMAIIAIIISFGFCIVAVARKVTDVSGTSKHTIGQIMSNFIRSLIVIILLNLCIVAAIKVTNVIFDRINYSMEHAETLQGEQERVYTNEEFATMTRILATMGNYAANPSSESRYNVNACFNAIRGELLTLYEGGCFNYDFPVVQTGKHTWQSALAQVAKSANLQEDLQLDTYYPTVQEAVILCFEQLKTNSTFKPQETAVRGTSITDKLSTAMMTFLVASMGSEENEQFRNGGFDDALRRSYINGEKDFLSFSDVNEDFAITQINYLIGLIVAAATILFLGKVVLLFIVRMFNVMMLYVVSPLFASSMSLDEGSRFQNWTQSFVMQLVATYGSVVMMRIYLLVVPIVVNSDLEFFPPGSFANHYTIYGQLIFVLAGAWAVSRATSLISGALTGNATGSIQEADSTFGEMLSREIGAGRFRKELGRIRFNRDSAKNAARGRFDKSLRPDGAEDEGATAVNELKDMITGRDGGRGLANSDKQTHDDTSLSHTEEASMQRMRKDLGMGSDVVEKNTEAHPRIDKADTEERLRANVGLNRMRDDMGLFAVDAPDSFDLDSIPDLAAGPTGSSSSRRTSTTGRSSARTTGSRTGGTKTTGTTGSTVPTKSTAPRTGSTSKTKQHRDMIKSRLNNRQSKDV